MKKKRVCSIFLLLMMVIGLLPSAQMSVICETTQNLDLSALSEMTENVSESGENYSYLWTVEESDDETVRTLELTLDGADIQTLILPCKAYGELNIIINTESDSYISEINESYIFQYSHQWDTITFNGEGKIEVEYMNAGGGGNDHIITVASGANVYITGDTLYALSFGASGGNGSTLNVEGFLSVNGGILCGQTIIGSKGHIICKTVQLGGCGAFDEDETKNAFVLNEGGKLEALGETEWIDDATGEQYAALSVVVPYGDTTPVEEIINIPEGILPEGYSLYKLDDSFATIDDGNETPDDGIIYAATSIKLGFVNETYKVMWKNYDGEILETDENVAGGSIPEYNGEIPTKEGDAQFSYEFEGWSPDTTEVTEDAEYIATFKQTVNKYSVVFQNWDGSELQREELEYGLMPEYRGETPEREANAEFTYSFSEWTPHIEEVTGEAIYKATYTESPVSGKMHTVKFDVNGGSSVDDVTVKSGEKIIKVNNPTKSGYSFEGWYKDIDLTEEYDFDSVVTSDFTLYAKWQKQQSYSGGGSGVTRYTVKFETDGGTVIKETRVRRNDKLTKPADPEKKNYIFDGWYTEKTLENAYDFDAKVVKNFTLYAKWRKNEVSDTLNTEEHFAYVKGYNDNTIRPENNITRAETTEIFFRLLNEEIKTANLAYNNNFEDVDENAWYNTAVSTMAKLEIVKGKTPLMFAPDEFITRAEFAAICARFDENDFETTVSFTDIDGHWAEKEIYEAASRGWIKGYEDGTFRPDEFITRAEAVTMINRMTGRIPETVEDLHGDMIKWTDNSDETVWYYIAIQEATNDHSYIRKSNGNEEWK